MAKIKSVNSEDVFAKFSSKESSGDETLYKRTGLIAFDCLTKGKGLPRRRLIHIWAPNGTGKTTVLYSLARALVRDGEGVLWAGIEPSQKLAEDMGLRKNGEDIPGFTYADLGFYDELQQLTDAFMASDKKWMIIDSITAVNPSPDKIQKDGIEASVIGVDARIQSVYFRLYHALLKQTDKSIIYITQGRNKIATRPGEQSGLTAAGGEASSFYSDLRITIIGNAEVAASDMGSGQGKAVAGKKGWFVAEKGRHAPPFTRIPVTIVFGRGLSNIQSLYNYATWAGIITQSKAYFKVNWKGVEKSLQGRTAMYEWVRENQASILEDFYIHVDAYFVWLQETRGGSVGIGGGGDD